MADRLMDMSSVDFSKCEAVYEDGSYDIYFQSDKYLKNDIESIDVCVNGERVGSIALSPDTETVEGYTKYNDSLFAKQPFLLHYDLIALSFIMPRRVRKKAVTSTQTISRMTASTISSCHLFHQSAAISPLARENRLSLP